MSAAAVKRDTASTNQPIFSTSPVETATTSPAATRRVSADPEPCRLVGEKLLHTGGGRDPVGDGGPVQEGVTDGARRSAQGEQPTGEGEPSAGAVDDALDGEADAEGQRGDGHEVQQPPRPAP
ncbi:hypothetical protein GCM10020256_68250 [Streptomyces thermocoprophilus]